MTQVDRLEHWVRELFLTCVHLPVGSSESVCARAAGPRESSLFFLQTWVGGESAFSVDFERYTCRRCAAIRCYLRRSLNSLIANAVDIQGCCGQIYHCRPLARMWWLWRMPSTARRLVLIGHSMGGAVIAEAARSMPVWVIGLIGVDTLTTSYPLTQKELDQMRAPLVADFPKGSREFVAGMLLPSTDPQIREWILADMSAAALRCPQRLRRNDAPVPDRRCGAHLCIDCGTSGCGQRRSVSSQCRGQSPAHAVV